MVQHSERAHALLSASSAHRWLNCTPSARLEDAEQEKTSEYAEEGTTAHEYAELLLRKYFQADRPYEINNGIATIKQSKWYNQVFEDAVQDYVTEIVERMTKAKNQDANAFCMTEQRVDFAAYVPDGFGTADCVIVVGRTVNVIDLKFGKGVAVEAHNNPQLMLYALGVYDNLKDFCEIDEFILTIIQPRLGQISDFSITLTELLRWAVDVVVPRAQMAMKGGGEAVVGDWCRFCRAKKTCPVLIQEFEDLTKLSENPINPNDVELDRIIQRVLAKGDQVAKWISDIKALALHKALQGEKVDGYKLVEGRSQRKYTNPEAVASMLETAGFKQLDIYNFTLKPITQLEKFVGKKLFGELSKGYVEKPKGQPTLVPASDPREEYDPKLEFTDLDETNEND